MWLLPVMSGVASLMARIFYRFSVAGAPVSRRGPALLLANHTNSLVDPVLVTAAAGRPLRFLAKSPLFTNRRVGWLVRAAGAIPVYRRMDDAEEMGRNVEMFAAVYKALAQGAAIGVFPEGISHNRPSLARLRTGSARVALGFAAQQQRTLPLIPVGLVMRDKGRFRSQALALLGEPVAWSDLAERGVEDAEAVRELTRRIDLSLRRLTINLERWEDRPLVECVEALWEAEAGQPRDEGERLTRVHTTTEILATLRRRNEDSWRHLYLDLREHCQRLRSLGLSPASLRTPTDLNTALRWAVRRLHILALPALALAAAGWVLYWVPFRLTAAATAMSRPTEDERSTYKLLIGVLTYSLWTVLLAAAAWTLSGAWSGLASLVLVPVIGLMGLWVRERWRLAWKDARSFFLLHSRRELIEELRQRQAVLAAKLLDLYQLWQRGELSDAGPSGQG